MNILYVLEHYHPYIGGAEQLFQSIAESVAKKRHTVRVVTTRYDPNLPKKEIINGVEIIRLDCGNRFGFVFWAWPYLLREMGQFDMVHTSTYTAAWPTWFANLWHRKITFLTFHEYWGKLWFQLPFLSTIQRYAYFLFEWLILKLPFHNIIAVSDFTQKRLEQQGKKNVVRIYNGLADRIHPPRLVPNNFTCIYFGRLGVSKGLDLLIPAMALHQRQFADSIFHLVIPTVPAGMFRNIKSLLQQHHLQHIQLHHHLEKNDLNQLICESSCVIIPSYSEGFCFAAVEAARMGIPIIHSNRTALKETVSGLHIPMEEFSIKGVQKALEKASAQQWKSKASQRFPLSESIEAYMALYEKSTGKTTHA